MTREEVFLVEAGLGEADRALLDGNEPGLRPAALARIDHRFGNEGDFGRPERFSESFAIDPVQVE